MRRRLVLAFSGSDFIGCLRVVPVDRKKSVELLEYNFLSSKRSPTNGLMACGIVAWLSLLSSTRGAATMATCARRLRDEVLSDDALLPQSSPRPIAPLHSLHGGHPALGAR